MPFEPRVPAASRPSDDLTFWSFFMHTRFVWCAVATLALAGAASGLAGCSEGPKPAPAPVAPIGGADGGGAPSAPQGMGVPKPGKAVPGASAAAAPAAAPAAAAPAAPAAAAAAPGVKAPSVKGPPKGKAPVKLQGNNPQAEPF